MGIRLFNLEYEKLGSIVCAITSILLISLALLALVEFGEYVVQQILSVF